MIRDLPIDCILTEALELPPGQRDAYLDRACESDAALKAKLHGLIAALDRNPAFLASPTAEIRAQDDDSAAGFLTGPAHASHAALTIPAGSHIGPYRLLERLGEGGFGTVYLAEQQQPVQRRVALKIIKPGMDSRQVIARFEAERQALAMMDHPNIARVLDGGTTQQVIGGGGSQPVISAGLPYFVMEIVRGVPITRFCDQQRLGLRERLELFTDVCHAVQHAHQKGIIHRDLKPSNILVSRHDGGASTSGRTGLAKIIDFGIAKAIAGAGSLTDMTIVTEARQLLGTPAYMSPEQAGLSDLDIDTRSDIYSLGVLLYELLTGTTPFDADRLRRADFDELRRIIREEEPPRPSARLSARMMGSAGVPPAVDSSSRSLDPPIARSLVRSLRGDLDWIVMKCLEKDRARRYESASGLVTDVLRYLHDEPVSAGPPSPIYRLCKGLRRYRLPVTIAAAFLALLAVGTVASTVFWQRAEGQAEQARQQRDTAERTTDFLVMTIARIGARGGRDRELVKEVMDLAAEGVRAGEISGTSYAEARLRLRIAEVYSDIGEFALAHEMQQPVEAMARRSYGPDSLAVAQVKRYVAETFRREGHLDEAEALARESVRMYRAHPEWGPGDDRCEAEWFLAHILADKNRTDEAVVSLRDGLALADVPGLEPDERLCFVAGLALVLLRQSGPDAVAEAAGLMRESLAVCEQQIPLGRVRPWLRESAMSVLGETLTIQKKYAEAEPWLLAGYKGLATRVPPEMPSRAKVGVDFRRDALERIVKLYRAWDAAEPGAGRDGQAERWQRQLDAEESGERDSPTSSP